MIGARLTAEVEVGNGAERVPGLLQGTAAVLVPEAPVRLVEVARALQAVRASVPAAVQAPVPEEGPALPKAHAAMALATGVIHDSRTAGHPSIARHQFRFPQRFGSSFSRRPTVQAASRVRSSKAVVLIHSSELDASSSNAPSGTALRSLPWIRRSRCTRWAMARRPSTAALWSVPHTGHSAQNTIAKT